MVSILPPTCYRFQTNASVRPVAQVETQLNKTRESKKAQSSDADPGIDSDAGQLFSSSFRPEKPPPRPADVPQTSRQPSIPESQDYSPMPDRHGAPFTLPIATMSADTRLLPEIMDSMATNRMPDPPMMDNLDLGLDTNFSWEMIGLGLEEPMPTQEAADELYGLKYAPIQCLTLI